MKITLQHLDDIETEIIIKGNVATNEVQQIIALLNNSSVSSKIVLYDTETEIFADITEVHYFEIIDRKSFAITAKGKYICKHTLGEISALYKKQGIAQINKSTLVNVKHVKSLAAEFSGNYTVNITNGEQLIVSRFYMKAFRNSILEG